MGLMETGRLLSLWGKSDDNNPANYHPLLFHLLDVGNVTRLLWFVLPAPVKANFARAVGLHEADTERVVVLLAAQHDLGKASTFQRKVSGLNAAVEKHGLSFRTVEDAPHGYVTTKVLPALVAGGVGGWAANTGDANLLARIIGGHHGTFPDALDTGHIGETVSGDGAWDDVRRDLLQEVAQLFHDDLPPVQLPNTDRLRDPALVPLLGGLVSVADWIGSSQDHFPPSASGNFSPAEYMVESQKRAKGALETFGWIPATKFANRASFKDIFSFEANSMQKAVVTLADNATAPYLLIVEAAMGEGKTEAALYAIDRALTTHQAHGFYFALPTQATGNALFERVLKNYIGRHKIHNDVNLQLVHSGSFLSTTFDKLRMTPVYGSRSATGDGSEGRVLAETWFTYRKRPLLAPFGIGTIDQSLTGVLQTRHWFVRLFGLAGKVVVFDEIHAYDVYMSELIKRLIGWLRALGCTVILLSATLSEKQRRDLLQAWDENVKVAPAANYPRLTFSANGITTAKTVPAKTPPPQPKSVEVEYAPVDLAPLAGRMAADLPHGGCAVVICNTVARAQEAYRVFYDRLKSEGWEVHLFHARTLSKWRNDREKEVLHWFGKDGKRPPKAVLIATQVVEQSLDLDFDWMVSEMAPIDLLLQRMGRLWRHKRDNRPSEKARFLVLCDETETGLPVFPAYSELIYAPYILLRSRLALQASTLRLPDHIEPLIRDVYDAELGEDDVSGEWWEKLKAAKEKQENEFDKDAEIARTNMVPSPERGAAGVLKMDRNDTKRDLRDDENPETHPTMRATTRLGEPSISLVCVGTDRDGKNLASPILTAPASVKEVREILGFGLSLSQRGLFHELVKTDAPPAWKESPHLRYHRVLKFEQGVASCAGYTLRLSKNEGLEIKKEEKVTEE